MTAPVIRGATPADLSAVETLVAGAGLPLAGLAECVVAGTAVVAIAPDGGVAGVAATERHGTTAVLRSVAVAEGERGRGLGRALVDRALADAGGAGVREAWLLTETAATWFARLGWTAADRTAAPAAVAASVEFAGACPASAIALRRAL